MEARVGKTPSILRFQNYSKLISPKIPNQPWFQSLNGSRSIIVLYSRLRIGHNLLPNHAFMLGLNQSPAYTLPNCGDDYCDFRYLLISCPYLHSSRNSLKIIFHALSINFSYTEALSSNNLSLIKAILNFTLKSGFKI